MRLTKAKHKDDQIYNFAEGSGRRSRYHCREHIIDHVVDTNLLVLLSQQTNQLPKLITISLPKLTESLPGKQVALDAHLPRFNWFPDSALTPLTTNSTHLSKLQIVVSDQGANIHGLTLAYFTGSVDFFDGSIGTKNEIFGFATVRTYSPEASFALMLTINDWELNWTDFTIFLGATLHMGLTFWEQWLHQILYLLFFYYLFGYLSIINNTMRYH